MCNERCPFGRKCYANTTIQEQIDLVNGFWGVRTDPAPSTSEKKRGIKTIYDDLQGKRIDGTDTFSFKIKNRDICEAALLNLLGYSDSKNVSDAPHQWKTYRQFLLGKEKLPSDDKEFKVKQASEKLDSAKAYLNYLSSTFFGDTFADANGLSDRTRVS